MRPELEAEGRATIEGGANAVTVLGEVAVIVTHEGLAEGAPAAIQITKVVAELELTGRANLGLEALLPTEERRIVVTLESDPIASATIGVLRHGKGASTGL